MKKVYQFCYRVDERAVKKREEILCMIEERTGKKMTPSKMHQMLWRFFEAEPECLKKLMEKIAEYAKKY